MCLFVTTQSFLLSKKRLIVTIEFVENLRITHLSNSAKNVFQAGLNHRTCFLITS